MIIFIALLLVIGRSHLIISVTPSNSIVSSINLIATKILVSSEINNNSLTLRLTTDFTISQPCLVDGSVVGCSITTSTNAINVLLSNSFIASTYYIITLNVTNPSYASNFLISGSVSGSSFSNTGPVTTVAKTIACSLTPTSQYVGEINVGSFSMSNDALPANSIVTVNSSFQSVFPNLFTSSPACSYGNLSLACSLSNNYGQQFLTITSPPRDASITFTVNSINNPPYNSSFANIGIQIQNAAGYFMQICSFTQQAVNLLRDSKNISLNNWNTQIGAVSSVTLVLSTYFTPYSTSLIWVHPWNLTNVVLSPASSISTIGNSITSDSITGATAIGNSLSFACQLLNPSYLEPIISTIYVVYSSNLFIEKYTITSMTLSPLSFVPILSITESRTMLNSTYNISITIPFSISGGFIGTLSINYGYFSCSNFGLNSLLLLTLSNCSANYFAFSSNSTISTGTFWVSFNVQNYFSTISNSISITLTSPSPNLYLIGSGTTTISLTPNNQSFSIINQNTTFASPTIISIIQSQALNINNNIKRVITIQSPSDIILYSNTTVNFTNSTQLVSYSITQNTFTITFYGFLNISIANVNNPVKYNGSLIWTLSSTDLSGNPSSSSSITMTPMYTSANLFFNASLSDTTIEATGTMVLTIIPALQYYSYPILTITFSNSLVLTPCLNCTSISSNIIQVTYFAAIMRLSLLIQNNGHPNGNSISIIVSKGSLIYETSSISYSLTPMTYGFNVFESGLYGTFGIVNITITKSPTQAVVLAYSDMSTILRGQTCETCSNSQVIVTGIVQYFQTFTVTLTGTYNNLTYAKASVLVNYVCKSIQGCRICINQTLNDTTSLLCQLCFNSSLTAYYLLYKSQCLQGCPISTYSNGVSCVSCPALCYICTISACTQCEPSYYIYNNTCINKCPAPLVNDAYNCILVPIICSSHCVNCPTSSQCTACDTGYVLANNLCYSSCPSGYNLQGSSCILFIPPQQTKYFPFPFVISAFVIFVALWAMKCFQKRSLIMGNLIAFLSFVEIGSIIMTLTYTLQSSDTLLTQALCYIFLLSKISLNLIFLFYFCKIISIQDQFQTWRLADQSHQKLYKILIVLSSTFSFQIIRIIYSRLMGLPLFFGKFNTALIFKPLNYFTLAYFLTSGASMIFLSVQNIIAQDGYHTSVYYSSIESIILEALLVITCIADNKKGYDDQFFEYQVYKVSNEYESSHIEPVEIEEEHAQNAGSMHEMQNAISSAPQQKRRSSQIVKNPTWVRKMKPLISVQDGSVQMQIQKEPQSNIVQLSNINQPSNQESNKQYKELVGSQIQNDLNFDDKQRGGIIQNKSIFRRKIIDEWRQQERMLPHKIDQMKQGLLKKNNTDKNKSQSPKNKKNRESVRRSIKRASSMDYFQIKLPQFPQSIPQKIKQYFHNKSRKIQQEFLVSKNQSRLRQAKANIDANEPKSMTLEVENQNSSNRQESNEDLLTNRQNEKINNIEFQSDVGMEILPNNRRRRVNDGQILQHFSLQQQFEDQLYQASSEQQKQIEIQDNLSYQRMLNINGHANNENHNNGSSEAQGGSNKKMKLVVNYRYEGGDQKEKKYRTKKRKVNRQTEQVYLQRLVASSDKKSRQPRFRKLQF